MPKKKIIGTVMHSNRNTLFAKFFCINGLSVDQENCLFVGGRSYDVWWCMKEKFKVQQSYDSDLSQMVD